MTKPEPTKFLICGLSSCKGAAGLAADTIVDDEVGGSSFLTEILTTVGNTLARTLEIPGMTSSACTGMEASQTTAKASTGHPRKQDFKPHRLMITGHQASPTSTVWPGKRSRVSALGFLGTTPCGAGGGV